MTTEPFVLSATELIALSAFIVATLPIVVYTMVRCLVLGDDDGADCCNCVPARPHDGVRSVRH